VSPRKDEERGRREDEDERLAGGEAGEPDAAATGAAPPPSTRRRSAFGVTTGEMKSELLDGTFYPFEGEADLVLVRRGLRIRSARFWQWAGDPNAVLRGALLGGATQALVGSSSGGASSLDRAAVSDTLEALVGGDGDDKDDTPDGVLDCSELVGAVFDASQGAVLLQFRESLVVGKRLERDFERLRAHFERRATQITHDEALVFPGPLRRTSPIVYAFVLLALAVALYVFFGI